MTDRLAMLMLPGGLGTANDVEILCGAKVQNETIRQCWARKANTCKRKLDIWRPLETKKDYAKVFTIVYIVVGIGVLGALAGACGDLILDTMSKLFTTTESLLHTAANATESVRRQFISAKEEMDELTKLESQVKTVVVTSAGLALIIALGAIVYSYTEKMRVLDAIYFTVVTATTVGFGDYYPESNEGKIFTLLFVPFSVVTVGSAISYIAQVPLESRKKAVDKFVLDQFVENLCDDDFDDIRRSAKLETGQRIHQNDFLIAMLSRLDAVDTHQMAKCRRLFDILDQDHTGSLDHNDIELLIADREQVAKKAEQDVSSRAQLKTQGTTLASLDATTDRVQESTAVFPNPLDAS